ncbi:MAG: hypothetical protein ACYC5M_01465 [Anaerolineae bacterium]
MILLRQHPAQVLDRAAQAVWRTLASPRVTTAALLLAALVVTAGGPWPELVPSLGSGWSGALGLSLPWSGRLTGSPVAGTLLWADMARLALALAAATSLARLAHILQPGWQVPRAKRLVTLEVALPGALADGQALVVRALAWTGRSVAHSQQGEAGLALLARRAGAKRWLPGLAYAGVLVLLGAFAVSSLWGWVGQPVTLLLGEARSLGADTGLDARLEQIAVLPDADGGIQPLQSRIAVSREGEAPQAVTLEQGGHRVWQGIGLYQLGLEPAARMAATDRNGGALALQHMPGNAPRHPVLRVSFTDGEQEQLLFVPESDLLVHLIHYPSLPSIEAPGRVLHVQLSRASDGSAIAEQFLTENGWLEAEGTRIDVAFEYGVTLLARHDPQRYLVLLGGLLLLLGLSAAALGPPRPAWVLLWQAEDCVLCRIAVPRGRRAGKEIESLRAILAEGAHHVSS